MEENSSSQMGRFRSQWLLEIRFPCRDSEDSSDYSTLIFNSKSFLASLLAFFDPPPPSTHITRKKQRQKFGFSLFIGRGQKPSLTYQRTPWFQQCFLFQALVAFRAAGKVEEALEEEGCQQQVGVGGNWRHGRVELN